MPSSKALGTPYFHRRRQCGEKTSWRSLWGSAPARPRRRSAGVPCVCRKPTSRCGERFASAGFKEVIRSRSARHVGRRLRERNQLVPHVRSCRVARRWAMRRHTPVSALPCADPGLSAATPSRLNMAGSSRRGRRPDTWRAASAWSFARSRPRAGRASDRTIGRAEKPAISLPYQCERLLNARRGLPKSNLVRRPKGSGEGAGPAPGARTMLLNGGCGYEDVRLLTVRSQCDRL